MLRLRGASSLVALVVLFLTTSAAWAKPKHLSVRIEGMKYVPERVEAHVGDTITWTNTDMVPHTVTASDDSFESGAINQSKKWKLVVKKACAVNYECRYHPGMHGVVDAKR